MATLAERLGHRADARLVIISCDDLGACHASNVGVYDALRHGVATSASLMVPAPWAREAAARYRGEDVGVHLTLNAEHELYRWGPVTQSPSLLDGDGGFPRTVEDLWDHADLDELRRECRAQIERAIVWGFDVSHLSAHLSAMTMRPEFFDIYVELAVDDFPVGEFVLREQRGEHGHQHHEACMDDAEAYQRVTLGMLEAFDQQRGHRHDVAFHLASGRGNADCSERHQEGRQR